MGVYNSTHIGPYILVKNSVKEKEVKEYFNSETNKKVKWRFNPETGVESIERVRVETVVSEVNLYENTIEGFREDEFFRAEYSECKSGYSLWMCNSRKFSVGCDELFTVNLLELDIIGIMDKFKLHYDLYFRGLDGLGIEYELCYGVVSYAH